jgi:hypothetical protein
VPAERRADFTDLVRLSAESVHRAGGLLILTLPRPRKEGNDWNSGAYDWKELARHADYLKIAPERDQGAYRTVVPEALAYLTGEVEPGRLVLTVSPLSAERSEQGIRTLTTLQALSLASQFSVRDRDRVTGGSEVTLTADNLGEEGGAAGGINWDATTATVAYTYRAENAPRTVWIENQYSAAFKAEFVSLWKLGGIAVDDASANEALSSIWPAIVPLAEGRTPELQQPNGNLLKPEWLIDNRPHQVGQSTVTWARAGRGWQPSDHPDRERRRDARRILHAADPAAGRRRYGHRRPGRRGYGHTCPPAPARRHRPPGRVRPPPPRRAAEPFARRRRQERTGRCA